MNSRDLSRWLFLLFTLGLPLAGCGGGSSNDDDDDDITTTNDDDDDVTSNDDDDITSDDDDDDDDTTNDDDSTDDDDFPTDFWSEDVLDLCDLIESNSALGGDDAGELTDLCVEAARAYSEEEYCESAELLEELVEAVGVHHDPLGTQEVQQLTIPARRLRYFLAMDKGLPDDCPSTARIGKGMDWEVGVTGPRTVKGKATFGEPLPQQRSNGDGTITYTGLEFTSTPKPSTETGHPTLPKIQRLIAMPQGSTPDTICTPGGGPVAIGLLLPAVQKVRDSAESEAAYMGSEPPDPEVYRESPPEPDPDIYESEAPYPSEICHVTPLGDYRGVPMAILTIFGGRFHPDTETYELFEHVDFEVNFNGGTTTYGKSHFLQSPFGPDPSGPFFAPLNGDEVGEGLTLTKPIGPDGEELMIITPPDFIVAANALRDWRNNHGIITNVFVAFDGPAAPGPDTREALRDFIKSHYNTAIVPPSYLLLIGDAEFIPTFYVPDPAEPFGGNIFSTDFPYAQLDGDATPVTDWMGELSYGRLPVDTHEEAMDIVNKIIAYESNPPMKASYYSTAAINSEFQCCRRDVPNTDLFGTDQRTFIQASEFSRNVLQSAGKTVKTVYRRTVDPGNIQANPPMPPYSGVTELDFYENGAPAPSHLSLPERPADFWQNFTTDSVLEPIDAGAFLVTHRGHGFANGWADPPLTTTQVNWEMANEGLWPVVFSVNCTSGVFDDETAPPSLQLAKFETFGEAWIRKANAGAVAFIGAGRTTPHWANSVFYMGLFDALYPFSLPGFGSDQSVRRLGDVVAHAKRLVFEMVSVPEAKTDLADAQTQTLLYGLFGDPTMRIWLSNPHNNTLGVGQPVPKPSPLGLLSFDIPESDGLTITAYQEGIRGNPPHPIGRAKAVGGSVDIPTFNDPLDGLPVKLSACMPDAMCVDLGEIAP